MTLEVEVCPDVDAVTERASQFVAERANAAVSDHGRFTFAVSGGHTPWAMFAALASKDMPWEKTSIYQVDERVAPPGDGDRNLTHLRESLPPARGSGYPCDAGRGARPRTCGGRVRGLIAAVL